jgi:carboxyl-terminal processing protease
LLWGLVCLLGLLTIDLSAQRPVGRPTVTVDRERLILWKETFELVWRTVKEKHFDERLSGEDWDRVGAKYRQMVDVLQSESAFNHLLQRMLEELGQSHFNILLPAGGGEISEQLDDHSASLISWAGIGIELRLIDEQAVIYAVNPGSPAARAALRAGSVITHIDGHPINSLSGPIELYDNANHRTVQHRFRQIRLLQNLLDGRPGSEVRLVALQLDGRSREYRLIRETPRGVVAPAFGNFPPSLIHFESRRIGDDIGYLRFNIFAPAQMENIRRAIREFSDPERRVAGLIIDLRGNPGGMGAMANGIAGLLTERPGTLGTMNMRTAHMNFAYFPQPHAWLGPVVILIDGLSGSTSEILAAGLQENGRVKIVGQRSLGAALPSYLVKLPTGGIFQYAIADYVTPRGVLIEGRGVIPDLEVGLDLRLLLEGRDSQIEAAVRLLRSSTPPR